jgi:hypothetical protein
MDSDLFAVLDSDQMASIDPDVVATMAINSARVELVSWDVELTADSDGIPALDTDRTAGFDSDRMAAMEWTRMYTGGVDSHVDAVLDLDVMVAIELGLVEDNSEAATAADSDGLMGIDSVVTRQDVIMVVSPVVMVETYSDGMVAIESEVMATMDVMMITMRNPG